MSRLSQMVTDLVDLDTAMVHDDTLSATERALRDRGIATTLSGRSDFERLRGWLHERRKLAPFTQSTTDSGTQVSGVADAGTLTGRGTRLVSTLLVVAGLLLGWACALAVFGYDLSLIHI